MSCELYFHSVIFYLEEVFSFSLSLFLTHIWVTHQAFLDQMLQMGFSQSHQFNSSFWSSAIPDHRFHTTHLLLSFFLHFFQTGSYSNSLWSPIGCPNLPWFLSSSSHLAERQLWFFHSYPCRKLLKIFLLWEGSVLSLSFPSEGGKSPNGILLMFPFSLMFFFFM